jgi:hypothetical protein
MWSSTHATPWSHLYNECDRRSHQKRTKQRGQELTSWTWDEILDGKRSWTWVEIMAGKDCLPWKQVEIVQECRRNYEGTRLAQKPERQLPPKNNSQPSASCASACICRAKINIQPGWVVPALRSRPPVRLHSPVRPVPPPHTP